MGVQQQQLLNLFLLVLVGAYSSNLYLLWYEVGAVLLFTWMFDRLLAVGYNQKRYFTRNFSSLSTAIGVMLMMASTHFYIYLVVIALGLFQKYALEINKHHFFNPSNFALIVGLFFFYDEAHIVLGQLGNELWLSGVLLVLALSILVRVNRWRIPLFFTLAYLLFEYLLVVRIDPLLIMEEIYYRFYSVSFVLFILFMLTDPKTTPQKPYQQIIFATLIAFLAVGLERFYGFRVQHLFLALFVFSLFTPLLMEWQSESRAKIAKITLLLFVLAIVVIINIESQSPFYFTMDG